MFEEKEEKGREEIIDYALKRVEQVLMLTAAETSLYGLILRKAKVF